MALDKKLSDICERLEWTVREDNDGTIELAKFSPAGGDFNICVDSKDFIQNVKEYHIVHTTNASTVWGWVDADKVVKA